MLRGMPERFVRQTLRQRRWPQPAQRLCVCDQHRSSCRRIPQRIPRITQRRQLRLTSAVSQTDGDQRSVDAVPRRRAKHDGKEQIRRARGSQQHPCIHICIKDPACHRNAAGQQQSQSQNAARHSAGHCKQQQRQPEKPPLAAIGDQCHQAPCGKLDRPCPKTAAAGQEHADSISAAEQRRQQIALPPQRDSGQAGSRQYQQIIHQRI
jgi:hypothetical protein